MKKLEEIEKEYKGYKAKSTIVNSLEEFITFIEVLLGDIGNSQELTKQEIKNNKRWKFETTVRNYFLVLINQREVEVYDEDTRILKELDKLDEEYEEYFERIKLLATEENYKELLRLADFADDYYKGHMEFFENQREMLELELRGIHMFHPSYEDNRKAFREFMKKHLKDFETGNKHHKQYVKKG